MPFLNETFISGSPEETAEIGCLFSEKLKPNDIILLYGGMGAGKTRFVKGLGKGLSLKEEIVSPTFTLVNEYYGILPLFHFDLFRISGIDALYNIGFFDYLDRGGIIAAEWSENVPGIEKEFAGYYKIEITPHEPGTETRKITIQENKVQV